MAMTVGEKCLLMATSVGGKCLLEAILVRDGLIFDSSFDQFILESSTITEELQHTHMIGPKQIT